MVAIINGVTSCATVLNTTTTAAAVTVGTSIGSTLGVGLGILPATANHTTGTLMVASTLGGAVVSSLASPILTGTFGAGMKTVSISLASAGAGGLTGAVGSGLTSVCSAAGLTSGLWGWVILGAGPEEYTYDCWKPILHDESLEPSSGRYIKDVAQDPRIKNIYIQETEGLPIIELENIWDEKFAIKFFNLSSGELVAHAERV